MKSVGKEIRDDEDVELDDSESSAGLICPITSALPEHPVVSKICHHVYDKDAIVKYIRQQNQQGKRHVICPAIGCNQKISLSEIAEDPEVTRKVEKARKARDRNWEQME
ncbi:e3 sumo-protein ligase nse2 [Histomonas meleagridis]|uniref:e3 sumo-protein ligase nse2 n=1 Tax=Histomonas meleagridis TaxID=135588 RepID=UPI003559716D|nr:e3 sumo-protein ligase nse2 [Histomonas meleagridis]KAH0800516.1 e3 sumo-protein ligase nse2 [Histomonas meleagridis]